MIRKIKIKNIQSHKETELEFVSGINAIVGSSNNGKSAILRALYWLRYNRPLGIDNLLSHWAFDKKGNQIEPMEVTVENAVGTITRRRAKDENQYIVNGKKLNVVKTDVPEQVEELLCLTDTNIQRQQDSPFLLSLSSGQIAQYFNKTVRLDIIDKVLSNAESQRRKTSQEIKQVENLFSEYENKKEKYSWLDSVEKLLVKYENVSEKNDNVQKEINLLCEQIEKYNRYAGIKQKYNFVLEAKKIISNFEKLDSKTAGLDNEIENVSCSLDVFNECQNKIYPSFVEQEKLINQFEKFNFDEGEINYLEEKINVYNQLKNKMEKCKLQAGDLKKQLPKICPLCGAVMKEGVCENDAK